MKILLISLLVATAPALFALDLTLQDSDLRLEQSSEGGYYLVVRKKPDIQSILLTESTRDPERKNDSFAYRNPNYHPANGDEKQVLNGKFLAKKGRYTLISSTVVPDKQFGQAFRIFIPFVVVYGYPWSRHGEVQIKNGMYLNIRAFEKPYADYDTGAYYDNSFEIVVSQKPLELSANDPNKYLKDTVVAFKKVTHDTNGQTVYAQDKTDIGRQIKAIVKPGDGQSIDIVLCLDTSKSMEPFLPSVRRDLVPSLQTVLKPASSFRIGIVQFRDFFEEYLYKEAPFNQNIKAVQVVVDRVKAFGGGDIPEAVNEALYAAINDYPWQADKRLVILIGDAPPHPFPRGKTTYEMVAKSAKAKSVNIAAIVLPQ